MMLVSKNLTSFQSTPNPWFKPRLDLDGVTLIDHLFNAFDGLYPTRWRSAFANQQAIENWQNAWAEGFWEEQLTLGEIKRGISECRKSYAWPPSFAEFVKACRPSLDYERAFFEAVEQIGRRPIGKDVWSVPELFWAATSLGNDLLAGSYNSLKARWHNALDKSIEKIKSGELPKEIPPHRIALPAPSQSTLPPEMVRARAAELKEILSGNMFKRMAK